MRSLTHSLSAFAAACIGIWKQRLILSPQMSQKSWKTCWLPMAVRSGSVAAASTRNTRNFPCNSCTHSHRSKWARTLSICSLWRLNGSAPCSTSATRLWFYRYCSPYIYPPCSSAAGSSTTYHIRYWPRVWGRPVFYTLTITSTVASCGCTYTTTSHVDVF